MTDTAIAHFAKALPSAVKSRMLIDMVNCLDVADDHLRVKELRQSFFPRMFDFFSGQGGRRDAAIAQSQQTSLRAVVNVTTKLARELSNTNLALAEVGGRLGAVERSLAQVAHLAGSTPGAGCAGENGGKRAPARGRATAKTGFTRGGQ